MRKAGATMKSPSKLDLCNLISVFTAVVDGSAARENLLPYKDAALWAIDYAESHSSKGTDVTTTTA